MELEKTQKNVGKMLERFRKGKEDMSVVFTKGSSFSRGGKDEQGCYSRGRVIIFRNEKKIVDVFTEYCICAEPCACDWNDWRVHFAATGVLHNHG